MFGLIILFMIQEPWHIVSLSSTSHSSGVNDPPKLTSINMPLLTE